MRRPEELRPLSMEFGVQLHAGGSCLVKLGRTHVLCAANLEDRVPGWMKGKGSGWLTAEYGMLPAATHTRSDREAARGKQQGRTVEIQRLIGRSLRQAVDLTILGERTLTVDCDVLNADGGTRCAAITGAWVAVALALRSQGLSAALVRQVAAVSVGIVESGEGRKGLVLDLEYEEDHLAAVDCNLVAARAISDVISGLCTDITWRSTRGDVEDTKQPGGPPSFMLGGALELVELQGTGEGRSFTRAEAIGLMDLGLAGCEALMEAQRGALA